RRSGSSMTRAMLALLISTAGCERLIDADFDRTYLAHVGGGASTGASASASVGGGGGSSSTGVTCEPAIAATETTFDRTCDAHTGAVLWDRAFPVRSGSALPLAIAVDAEGSIFFAGQLLGDVAFDGVDLVTQGDFDIFIVKLDPAGEII